MTDREIINSIKNKLAEIEEKEDVRIIFAVESGSRAWGFESPDSDYDVRFIYVRKPEDYARLMPLRDVIEWQLDEVYDVSGWDLQKALRLMRESNPSIHEWCASGIVYMENELAGPFRELSAEYFIPKKAMHHYISMASNNYKTFLTGDAVKTKKYFYALRPVMAARWIAEKGTVPPMLFEELMEAELPADLKPEVDELLRIKRETPEIGSGPKVAPLNEYIIEEIEALKEIADKLPNSRNSWDHAEEFFRKSVFGK